MQQHPGQLGVMIVELTGQRLDQVLTGALHGDVGIVVVDDGLGVERPRPVVVGGALVVMAAGSSSM
ncbi:hypothetical protein [Nakamurella multipartita]|uniref:hypothetical protein n=1 Tax=Nakamurella multipartita TaxID=53461 RepID=UPI00059E1C53|nr:hypothetical protein [Nakamurella multipartita]